MPWSPVPKIPEIIKKLEAKGYTKEVSLIEIQNAIIEVTGVYTDKTIMKIIQVMERLSYIRQVTTGVWLINPEYWDKQKPKKPKLKEEIEEIDRRMEEIAGKK